MILKCLPFNELAERIKKDNCEIIIYGAGLVGSVILPNYIKEFDLLNFLNCFIDVDVNKQSQVVKIENFSFVVQKPEYLKTVAKNTVILISNSKFEQVINYLDSLSNLRDTECYIIPMMLVTNSSTEVEKVKKQSETMMIPKVIHYCWFGQSEMPSSLKMCLDSWKRMCPDYKIVEWNEDNYDVNRHKYTKEAYEHKRFGFVSDVARLDILYENGGIYLDTDVSLEKNLDVLLYQEGFVATEKWGNINSGGGCGFVKNHPMLKKLIEFREKFDFVNMDGSLNIDTNGIYETKIFMNEGYLPNNKMQVICNTTVYPSYVFHPYDYMSCNTFLTESTYGIHHFSGEWMDEADKRNRIETQTRFQEIYERANCLNG